MSAHPFRPAAISIHHKESDEFLGSGFACSDRAILTARHVVQDFIEQPASLNLRNLYHGQAGHEVSPCEIRMGPEGHDIALLRLDPGTIGGRLSPAPLDLKLSTVEAASQGTALVFGSKQPGQRATSLGIVSKDLLFDLQCQPCADTNDYAVNADFLRGNSGGMVAIDHAAIGLVSSRHEPETRYCFFVPFCLEPIAAWLRQVGIGGQASISQNPSPERTATPPPAQEALLKKARRAATRMAAAFPEFAAELDDSAEAELFPDAFHAVPAVEQLTTACAPCLGNLSPVHPARQAQLLEHAKALLGHMLVLSVDAAWFADNFGDQAPAAGDLTLEVKTIDGAFLVVTRLLGREVSFHGIPTGVGASGCFLAQDVHLDGRSVYCPPDDADRQRATLRQMYKSVARRSADAGWDSERLREEITAIVQISLTAPNLRPHFMTIPVANPDDDFNLSRRAELLGIARQIDGLYIVQLAARTNDAVFQFASEPAIYHRVKALLDLQALIPPEPT